MSKSGRKVGVTKLIVNRQRESIKVAPEITEGTQCAREKNDATLVFLNDPILCFAKYKKQKRFNRVLVCAERIFLLFFAKYG